MLNKNWPFNPQISCMKPINFASTCEMVLDLTTELEATFQDEVDCEDFLDLNEFSLFFFLYTSDW
jgi:hypothetical protein